MESRVVIGAGVEFEVSGVEKESGVSGGIELNEMGGVRGGGGGVWGLWVTLLRTLLKVSRVEVRVYSSCSS